MSQKPPFPPTLVVVGLKAGSLIPKAPPTGGEEQLPETLAQLVPNVFSRIVIGDSVAELQEELQRPEPVVMLVGSPGAKDVMIEFSVRAPGRVLWIHAYSAGVDYFQLQSLVDVIKAPFSNAHGAYSSMLAEYVILSCLYFSRQVARLQRNRAAKVWDRFHNVELRNASLGILGYGNIGRATAKVALPFGMRVLGHKRTLGFLPGTTDDLGVSLYSGEDGLREVLGCDYVVSALPLTTETAKFMTTQRFSLMKPTSIFINIGRGATVVEADLVSALKNGTIRGAALDVFYPEPLPESSELWSLPDDKIFFSPHNADISPEGTFADAILQFVGFAKDFVNEGKLPTYLVDLKRGY